MILSGFLSLILSTVSFAVAPICSNLNAVTCTEGVRSDGTGSTAQADSTLFIKQEFTRMDPSIRQVFEELISTSKGKQLVPLAMKSCRLNETRECRDRQSPSCKKILVTCLSRLYKTTEFDPALASVYDDTKDESRFFSASDAVNLVQNPTYLEAAKKITRINTFDVSADLKAKVANDLFPTVQMLLRKKISELPIDEPTRAKLDKTIASAKFAGVQCRSNEIDYSTRLGEALFPNANYDQDTHTFSICPAYLRYSSSEFDLTAVIAHELAHSIDPCQLGGGNDGGERRALSEADPDKVIDDKYLRKDFIGCLRSPTSIGAKSFRPVNPPVSDSEEMIGNDLTRLCQSDQINEVVSDWFAAETLAAYIPLRNSKVKPPLTRDQVQSGMANVFRSFCSPMYNQDGSTDVHPTNKQRLNSIFLAQPKLRSMMGCPAELSGKRYCDIQNPASLIGEAQRGNRSTPVPQTPSEAAQ